jgi:hypothetical protein
MELGARADDLKKNGDRFPIPGRSVRKHCFGDRELSYALASVVLQAERR